MDRTFKDEGRNAPFLYGCRRYAQQWCVTALKMDIMPNLHVLMHEVKSVLRNAYGNQGFK